MKYVNRYNRNTRDYTRKILNFIDVNQSKNHESKKLKIMFGSMIL